MDELWLIFVLLAILACWLFAECKSYADKHRHDWLAERKRTITRNAFKSRMGVR
jgi:hypothetical protein